MNISEFAASRGVEMQAVSRYISRHPELFDGKTEKDGKSVVLSDEALELLDKVYPLPKPVEIIEDKESRIKLIQTQELVIQLQGKLMEQTALLSEARSNKLLLEYTEEQLEETRKKVSDRDKQIMDMQSELEQTRKQLQEIKEKEEKRDKASLMQRIFKRW